MNSMLKIKNKVTIYDIPFQYRRISMFLKIELNMCQKKNKIKEINFFFTKKRN